MGSRRGSTGFTAVRSLLWPLGLAVGVGAFFAIRTGVPWLLSRQSGPIARGFNQGISAALASTAWIVLGMCCLVALASRVGSYQHRKLLDTGTTLESLAANGWRKFELLIGEAFRCQGHAVKEIGLGVDYHGIDLLLRKNGRRTMAQCKQWKSQRAGASFVREMYSLLAHHSADVVKILLRQCSHKKD